MEARFFGEPQQNNKRKLILGVVGALAIVGVVATVAVVSTQNKPLDFGALYQEELNQFHGFMETHGKAYTSHEEYLYRFKIFRDNLNKINIHNVSGKSYTMGVNQFADLTKEEFKAQYLSTFTKPLNPVFEVEDVSLPSSVDWRKEGAVTGVKDQGQCGSCWSFSATGCTEGAYFLAYKSLVSFSEQELVSCSESYGNNGCNGGLMDYAFQYIGDNGIQTESEYPYVSGNGYVPRCKSNITPYENTKGIKYEDCSRSTTGLKTCIAQGPTSVAVDAEQWQFYQGGVFSDCGTSLDHGVLAVGYTSNGEWIVKNSWGTSWGENGYITLASGNTCGVENSASVTSYQ